MVEPTEPEDSRAALFLLDAPEHTLKEFPAMLRAFRGYLGNITLQGDIQKRWERGGRLPAVAKRSREAQQLHEPA